MAAHTGAGEDSPPLPPKTGAERREPAGPVQLTEGQRLPVIGQDILMETVQEGYGNATETQHLCPSLHPQHAVVQRRKDIPVERLHLQGTL